MKKTLKRFIGDRAFYGMVLGIAIPIMLQNGVTSFVNMIDNLMVGSIGTEQMSGVSIVNQLLFVYNLALFGILSGAGIFTAQYFGKEDHEGVRQTFRLKLIFSICILAIAVLILTTFDEPLIRLFLHDTTGTGRLEDTLMYGQRYLKIMLIGLIPYAVSQCYTSTLREVGRTVIPMISSFIAVIVNLCLNYVLIFGKFGAPALGVEGAAIATVISRFAELLFITVWTHMHTAELPFVSGLYTHFRVSRSLIGMILLKGMPLALNETIWSVGMTILTQSYSTRSLDVVAALNISNVIFQLFNIIYMAFGNALGIIVGQLLGAGKMEEAKDTDGKLIFFSVVVSACVAIVLSFVAPLFPMLYNTTPEVRALATSLICVNACLAPILGFAHPTYFTLRSGGQVWITFVFDAGFLWVIQVPLAFCLAHFTSVPIIPLYACVELSAVIKCFVGTYFLRKGTWMNNIVS